MSVEQQQSNFKVPEVTKKLTSEEIEMSLPQTENDPPIFAGLKRVFLENAADTRRSRRK